MIFKEKKVSFPVAILSIVLILCLFAGFYAFAQFYVPLDTSPSAQIKEGGLTLNGGLSIGGTGTIFLTPQSSAPSVTAEGSMYYDSTNHIFKYRDNSGWQNVGGSSAGATGAIVGTYEIYYNEPDGTYLGCRAGWGQANCSSSTGTNSRCATGTTRQIMMYSHDNIGPNEYPNDYYGHYWSCHVELYGCVKN